MFHRKLNVIRRLNRNESGQSMLETAFCGSLFILLMFAIIDFGFLYYSKVTLQNAVRQAARYAITGNCSGGTCFDPDNGPGDRLNTIITTAVNYGFGLITSSNVSVTCVSGSCPSYAGYGSNNAGGPEDVVKVSVQFTYNPIIMWRWIGGAYSYTVSATFKNEPFQPPSS